jgi:hypothetical protein
MGLKNRSCKRTLMWSSREPVIDDCHEKNEIIKELFLFDLKNEEGEIMSIHSPRNTKRSGRYYFMTSLYN